MSTYNTIPFTNYTNVNFTFTYDKETYTVHAGETANYPEFLALHGAKHLVDRELIRDGKVKQLNDLTERDLLFAKILGKPIVYGDKEIKEESVEKIEVEEEFPDLKKLTPEDKKPVDDLSRKEMFAKLKALGVKVKLPKSNDDLRKMISQA